MLHATLTILPMRFHLSLRLDLHFPSNSVCLLHLVKNSTLSISCQRCYYRFQHIMFYYKKDGPGAPGGQSWTAQWLKFDNSYFKDIKEQKDEDLLVLPTDAILFDDPSFKIYSEEYAQDQDSFFKDYAEAHSKLSNLGAKFDPPEGISLDDDGKGSIPEPFQAAKYSSGKRELSEAMKQKIRREYEAVGGSPDKPLKSNYFLNIMIVVALLAFLTSLLGK